MAKIIQGLVDKLSIDIVKDKDRYTGYEKIDNVGCIPLNDSTFQELELLQISKKIREPKEEDFVGLQLAPPLPEEFQVGATEVGYERIESTGEATITSGNEVPTQVDYTNENIEDYSTLAYDLTIGIRYTQNDIEKMNAVGQLGRRGSVLNIVGNRIAAARRALSQMSDIAVFYGLKGKDAANKLTGIFDLFDFDNVQDSDTSYTSLATFGEPDKAIIEKVVRTGSAETTRSWRTKTGTQIILDILRGLSVINRNNIYNGKDLVLTPEHYWILFKPYSDLNGSSIARILLSLDISLPVIGGNGQPFFRRIIKTTSMNNMTGSDKSNVATRNGRKMLTKNAFMIGDFDVENIGTPILRPITMLKSVEDEFGVTRQVARLRQAGIHIFNKGAFYMGTDI